MKKTVLLIAVIIAGISSYGQANTWSVKFSNAILSRYTPTVDVMTNKGWEYSNSIMLHGIEKVNNWVNDTNYLNYIKKYVDVYVNAAGTINPVYLSTTLDKIHPGLLCLYLYQKTGLVKYKTAATNLKNYLFDTTKFKKTPDGGFWHKNDGTYNNIMMLDGIYMAQPFLAKYGSMFNDTVCTNTATFQALMLGSHVYDSTEHLAKHAWDYTKTKVWANSKTGASGEVWSRGLGWYMMAVVDILRFLPPSHPDYNKLKTLLQNLAVGIKNKQDATTGLWYQVVNKKDSTGNYVETSGSGMYIYALKIAADSNWIDTSYRAVARKGWVGLQKMISTYTDGKPAITSFAPGMSVQNNYTAYIGYLPVNCPAATGSQHPHGYCGLLMAASVMEFPLSTLPVQFINIKAEATATGNHIIWQVASEESIKEYIIQQSLEGKDFNSIATVKASGQHQYSWDDITRKGSYYYRIVAGDKNGALVYSNIVSVQNKENGINMIISPNPVNGNSVNIQFNNIPAGEYLLNQISLNGQRIASQQINILNNNEKQSVSLFNNIKGEYLLQLTGKDFSVSRKVVLE